MRQILDGLEPLQHPPGPQKGTIKDPTVQSLVRACGYGRPEREVTWLGGRFA